MTNKKFKARRQRQEKARQTINIEQGVQNMRIVVETAYRAAAAFAAEEAANKNNCAPASV